MGQEKSNEQFLVNLPEGWEDRTVYYFQGPEDSGVQHSLALTIDRELEGDDLAEFARDRIDQVMLSIQGAEILKDEPIILAGGNEAYECVIKWVPVDGNVIFRKLLYLILDGIGYSFSANFSKKTIKTIGVEVDRIINSLRPLKGPQAE